MYDILAVVILYNFGGVMKKKNGVVALCMAMSLMVGSLSGCAGKSYKVSYDYNASEYIALGNYKGVSVEVAEFPVTDEDLQKIIDQICDQYCSYEEVKRKAEEKDKIVLNIDAYISGQKVGGFSSEGYELDLSKRDFVIDGFEEKVVGLATGDKVAITGLFVPEKFSQEEAYAGRAITFNVEVLGVYEPVPAPYDDLFVSTLTEGEYKTVDEYNKQLIHMLEENAKTNRYNAKYDSLMKEIIESTQIVKEFPEEYVTKKVEEINRTAQFYAGLQEISVEEFLMQKYGKATAEEIANEIITMEFIYQEIVRVENMKITAKDYSKNLVATAQKRGYTSTERLISDYTEEGVVKLMLLDRAEAFIMEKAVEVAK